MTENHKSIHNRGMQFLETRRNMLLEDGQQNTDWCELAKLGRDSQAKMLRDQLATQLAMDKRDYLRDVQFAAAVETIVDNCGTYACDLLLGGDRHPRLE